MQENLFATCASIKAREGQGFQDHEASAKMGYFPKVQTVLRNFPFYDYDYVVLGRPSLVHVIEFLDRGAYRWQSLVCSLQVKIEKQILPCT
jgi:hypothetical protein